MQAPRPQLSKYNEGIDDIDAGLECFERFARNQRWAEDTWVVSLSPLLIGKALDVYTSQPMAEADDCATFKMTILKRYQLTAIS